MVRAGTGVAAVALPLALLAGAARVLVREEPWTLSPEAARIDDRLAEADPDIVILGNSIAGAAVDPEMLADELGDPDLAVARLSVNQTRPAAWYAVLENRVYQGGHKPRIVLVASLLSWTLDTGYATELGRAALEAQMTPDDTLIREKTFGEAGSAPLERALRRRYELRDHLLEGIRDGVAGLLHGNPGEPVFARGRIAAEEAFDEVFGREGAVDLDLNKHVIPIADATAANQMADEDNSAPERSYLPDLAKLAQENGAKLIFVRLPLPPSNHELDRVDAETEVRAVRLMNELGVGYVDLSGLELPEAGFEDFVHVNAVGRKAVTEALGEVMADWNVLAVDHLPPAPIPRRPERVVRLGGTVSLGSLELEPIEGTPCGFLARSDAIDAFSPRNTRGAGLGEISPVVVLEDGEPLRLAHTAAELSERCTGSYTHARPGLEISPREADPSGHAFEVQLSPEVPIVNRKGQAGWWVYPGGSLRFSMPSEEQPLAVDLLVEAFGGGKAPPTATVGSSHVVFERAGTRWRAHLDAPAPAGKWNLELASPADGPLLAIRAISLGAGDARSFVVGSPHVMTSPPVRLVGKPPTQPTKARWTSDPPAVTATTLPGNATRIQVERSELLAGGALRALGLHHCDPLRLLRGGEALEPSSCREVRAGNGQYCHDGDRLLLADATAAQPEYRVALDPTRTCDKGLWLYPGDDVTIRATAPLEFAIGADRLELRATVIGSNPVESSLHLRLFDGDRAIWESDLPLADVAAGAVELDLPFRLPNTAAPFLEVSSPAGAPYVALEVVSLSEERPFEQLPTEGAQLAVHPLVVGGIAAGTLTVDGSMTPLPVGRPVYRGRGWYGWRVPPLSKLAGEQAFAECAPVRVSRHGIPVESRITGEWLEFHPVAAPTRALEVTWSGARSCGGAIWVYPGETLKLGGDSDGPHVAPGSATLAMAADPLSDAGQARIRAGLRPLVSLDEKLAPRNLGPNAQWTLELGGGPSRLLLVELANRTAAPIALTDAIVRPDE
jgi:hypothetical protein